MGSPSRPLDLNYRANPIQRGSGDSLNLKRRQTKKIKRARQSCGMSQCVDAHKDGRVLSAPARNVQKTADAE